jgi:predicted Holliday junction resolvase-like endonuclease
MILVLAVAGVIAVIAVAIAIYSWNKMTVMEEALKGRNRILEETYRQIDGLKDKIATAEERALEQASAMMKKKERDIRKDAAKRSRAVHRGKILEQIVPILPGWDFLPVECRFLGSPIDLVVFDGLSGEDEEVFIYLLEVKSGRSRLSKRQRRIKEAVAMGNVFFEVYNTDGY